MKRHSGFLLARLVNRELLLPSPLQVLRSLLSLAMTVSFWQTLGCSLLRVSAGIVAATILGVLLAMLTEWSSIVRALVAPLMTLIKSTPVASFIILALIWLGRSVLPAVISGLMVLPVVWANVSAGIAGRDLPAHYCPFRPAAFSCGAEFGTRPWLESRHCRRGSDGTAAVYWENDLRVKTVS